MPFMNPEEPSSILNLPSFRLKAEVMYLVGMRHEADTGLLMEHLHSPLNSSFLTGICSGKSELVKYSTVIQ